jgi:hypothetical protein
MLLRFFYCIKRRNYFKTTHLFIILIIDLHLKRIFSTKYNFIIFPLNKQKRHRNKKQYIQIDC